MVSVDTASRISPEYGWSTDEELVLYVVHGVLHLVGYDDRSDEDRYQMRERERFYLTELGLSPGDRPVHEVDDGEVS